MSLRIITGYKFRKPGPLCPYCKRPGSYRSQHYRTACLVHIAMRFYLVMANWDSQQAYPLRSNMEIIAPQFGDTTIATEVISALQSIIIDYMSPV